jgi:hypothetical protein
MNMVLSRGDDYAGLALIFVGISSILWLSEIVWPIQQATEAELAIEYLEEIAFGFNPNVRQTRGDDYYEAAAGWIKKWQAVIRIKVLGDPTESDLTTVRAVARELDELIDPISVRVTGSDEDANVFWTVIPWDQFDEVLSIPKTVESAGQGEYISRAGVISVAWLVVDSGLRGDRRQHVIREEITQIVGLPRDSWTYPESIFHEGESKTTEFTELGKAVIRLLCDPRIEPGMTVEEIEKLGL